MKNIITWFKSLDGFISASEGNFPSLYVKMSEDCEITNQQLGELISLCGDTHHFTISAVANCEDDNSGFMRYDSHYEGILIIEIYPNEKE